MAAIAVGRAQATLRAPLRRWVLAGVASLLVNWPLAWVIGRLPAADRTPKQQADQFAAVARRDGSKRLATDSTEVLDGRRMSKYELRAELHWLDDAMEKAPRDQSRLLALATKRREQHDQRLAEATTRRQDARDLVALLEHGPARWLRRGNLGRVREQAKQAEAAYQVAWQAADRERDARQAQQQYQAHQEANPDLADRRHELLRVQAWRKRADARAAELLRPEWSRELGERPATVKGGRAWDRAVEQTIEYRQRWNVADAEHPLGRSHTAGTCRLSSGRRGGRRPGRLVACATSPATGPTAASGTTIAR